MEISLQKHNGLNELSSNLEKLSEEKEEKSESQEELWEIVEWVADRFEKEFPSSTVGIMGRKAREIVTRKGNTL